MKKSDIEIALERQRTFQRTYGERLKHLGNPSFESIRELQKQMLLPNERLLELSRSAAAAAAFVIDKEVLKGFASSVSRSVPAIQSLSSQLASNQQSGITEIAKDLAQRQSELLRSLVGPAVFASAIRTSEINSKFEGIAAQLTESHASLFKSFGPSVLASLSENAALANLNTLKKTHLGALTLRFRDVVEGSTSEDDLIENISSIVDEELMESKGNRFTTFEKLSIVISILSLLFILYQSGLQTIQYLDSKSAQPAPVIRIEFLHGMQRQLLEKYAPILRGQLGEVEYHVERNAKLMSKPTFRSLFVGEAIAGARALLIERNKKWMFVEVFHPIDAVSQVGWLNKKYSKRIK